MQQGVVQFLSSVTVVDTETTHLQAEQAQICEMAVGKWRGGFWHAQSELFNVEGGIPPQASARNCISNAMVQHEPTWCQSLDLVRDWMCDHSVFVAHNAEYDRQVLFYSAARADDLELAELFADPHKWLCTWRMSRRIYQHTYKDQLYGQNYLRYALDLDVPQDVGVHRAEADVQVCGKLLERITEDAIQQGFVDPQQPLVPQMLALTHDPILVSVWPMGKYRDQPLANMPTDYFLWALDNLPMLDEKNPGHSRDLIASVTVELEKRL